MSKDGGSEQKFWRSDTGERLLERSFNHHRHALSCVPFSQLNTRISLRLRLFVSGCVNSVYDFAT